MGYRDSTLTALAKLRGRGQRPDGPVIVGNDSSWANRNRFCFVNVADLGDDLMPLAGLPVIVRMARPGSHRETWQRLAMLLGALCVFDTATREYQWLTA